MKKLLEEIQIILGKIIVGIPDGILVGVYWFFKFPFIVYSEAKAGLKKRRIIEAKKILQASGEDIWEKHIRKLEAEKYDN